MEYTLLILVENQPGVLSRLTGLLNRKGINIDSLSIGPTEKKEVSKIMIVFSSTHRTIEQLIKQVSQLDNVLKVTDVTKFSSIQRELILIKVNKTESNHFKIIELMNFFGAKMVESNKETITLELSEHPEKIDSLIKFLIPFDIIDIVRTGKISMVLE
jgi:acetolactate synthase-1/3 small subunit